MSPKKTVVALLDDEEITEEALQIQGQIIQLRKQEYELKLRTLENVLGRRILEKAAAARSLSLEEFLRQEVDSKIPEPSPAEVEGFYWGERDKFREPLDKIREQVRQALKRAKIQEGRQTFLQKLRQQAAVRVLMEPPRVVVEAGNAPRKGLPAAPVTVVEFSDYQCPYCKGMREPLQQISDKYGDRVSFVFKDFPLSNIHPQARAAAEAAHCAGDQGKYWEYHHELFQAAAIDPELLTQAARGLKLDMEAFQACVRDRRHKATVEGSILEGQRLGVSGTPAFFVNGLMISGAQPFQVLDSLIEEELRGAARAKAGHEGNRRSSAR